MTSIEILWDVTITPVPNATAVHEWFTAHLHLLNPQGTRGYAIRLGPGEAEGIDDMPLRIDIDPDVGRAAVRWLPENLLAGSLPPLTEPLRVCEWTEDDTLVAVPGALACVDVETAVALAATYADTGERPGGNDLWVPIASTGASQV